MRLWIFLAFFVVGCSTSQRDALKAYREAFALGDYARAAELLKKAELDKDPKSRLLLLMEQGRLHYASGDFKSAAQYFAQAIELSDAQYTKSVTRESSKWIINDVSGEFFGSPYERSWLFYHQAMAHWKLYQSGQLPDAEARVELFAARAALLAWDSFFQDWQRSTEGKTLYRHDLVAKLVAAQVHEATGLRADKQIALQLYKDAWKIFSTLSVSYSAFNREAQAYFELLQEALFEKGDFKRPTSKVSLTPQAVATQNLILENIVRLTLEQRPQELSQLAKQLEVSPEQIDEAKKNQQATNVSFILEEGVILPKASEEISLGVQGLAKLSKDQKTQAQIARVGSEVIGAFAVGTLGLYPKSIQQHGNYAGARALMTLAAHEAAIAFEVPMIPKGEAPRELWLVIRDEKNAVVASAPWGVVTHLEDVARQSLEEESGQRILRTGTRVVVKHLSAILAAMAVYKNLSKGEKDNMLAKYAAVATYVGATKGIAMSERADTRAWQTLPRTLRLVDLKLAPGTYSAEIATKLEQNAWESKKALGPVVVTPKRAIFSYLVPQL